MVVVLLIILQGSQLWDCTVCESQGFVSFKSAYSGRSSWSRISRQTRTLLISWLSNQLDLSSHSIAITLWGLSTSSSNVSRQQPSLYAGSAPVFRLAGVWWRQHWTDPSPSYGTDTDTTVGIGTWLSESKRDLSGIMCMPIDRLGLFRMVKISHSNKGP